MPLYDYMCPACGLLSEYLQSFAAPAPRCSIDGRVMERQPSAAAFKIKGFSQANCYNGGQSKDVKVKQKDMKVTVSSH